MKRRDLMAKAVKSAGVLLVSGLVPMAAEADGARRDWRTALIQVPRWARRRGKRLTEAYVRLRRVEDEIERCTDAMDLEGVKAVAEEYRQASEQFMEECYRQRLKAYPDELRAYAKRFTKGEAVDPWSDCPDGQGWLNGHPLCVDPQSPPPKMVLSPEFDDAVLRRTANAGIADADWVVRSDPNSSYARACREANDYREMTRMAMEEARAIATGKPAR